MSLTLEQLAGRIGASVKGDGQVSVERCAPIDQATDRDITFLHNARYGRYLHETRAAAIIVEPGIELPDHLPGLVADDPYFAFRNALIELHGFRNQLPAMVAGSDGISALAAVHPTATVGQHCQLHPGVVIEQEACIGDRCVLYPGSYVGAHATVGDDTVLYPNAVVYDRCRIGNRVLIHANTVIGHDGFGYATHGGAHHKIPQTGVVVVEDDVEFGAGCAVERAAMGETRIGRGTKLADLVSIGHGTRIGAHCLLVSLVGVSGSVEVGDYVVLGGQVGVTGHLKIGNGVQVAAKSAVTRDVPAGHKVGGVPAIDLKKARRNLAASLRLDDMLTRIRALEQRIAELEGTAHDAADKRVPQIQTEPNF